MKNLLVIGALLGALISTVQAQNYSSTEPDLAMANIGLPSQEAPPINPPQVGPIAIKGPQSPELFVFPGYVKGALNLHFMNFKEVNLAQLLIIDMNGTVMCKQTIEPQGTMQITGLAALPKGVYRIRVLVADGYYEMEWCKKNDCD